MSCLECAEGGVGNDQHSGHGDLLQEVVNEEGKVGGPNLAHGGYSEYSNYGGKLKLRYT